MAVNGPNLSRLSGSSEGVRKQLGKKVDMSLQVLVDKRGPFIKGKATVTEGSTSGVHVNLDPSHISHACAAEIEPMVVKVCNTRHEDMVMENVFVTIDPVQHIR